MRAGTENGAAIAGFGAATVAALAATQEDASRMAALRDRLEAGLKKATPDVVIFGAECAAAAEYDAVCCSRGEGGDRHYRFRPQRGGGLVGFRLFLRQGDRLARARRHGR